MAAQYSEGVTGKPVSTYFERMKKDPSWDIANSMPDDGSALKVAKEPRTPRAKKEKVEGADEPPTNKTPLNKTQRSRVAMTPGSGYGRPAKIASGAEEENEDKDEDVNALGEYNEEAEDDMAVHGNGHDIGNSD
jgi:hypothetical protein